MTEKFTGKVAWFNKKRGFGFIVPDDHSKDIFVHYSGILSDERLKNLEDDQKVEFEIQENEKGRLAVNVKVIGESSKVKVEVSK